MWPHFAYHIFVFKRADLTDYDALADKAERGQLHTLRQLHPGTADPLDLAEVFMLRGDPAKKKTPPDARGKYGHPKNLTMP